MGSTTNRMGDGEMGLIYRIKPFFPVTIWRALTGPYWWWYNRARHQAAAVFDGRLRTSRQRLEELRNSHMGERCFILGNGPSLAGMDLAPLKSEVTFGLNRVYLLFPMLGFSTTYFVAVNTLVVEQCAEEIMRLRIPKFITWRARQSLRRDDQVTFLDTDYTGEASFSEDVTGRVFEGSTVTYVALQLAYHLGFSEVILIGVDHSFQAAGRPNVTVVSAGNDPDHFSTGYFPKGFRWQLPDLEASERAYLLARQAFEAAGRRILDATVGGHLRVFPRVDYHQLF